MKKLKKTLILLLTLLIPLAAINVKASNRPNFTIAKATKAMATNASVIIDVRGDSIMAGFDGETGVSENAPLVMQNTLRSYYNNNLITVINNSVTGAGTNRNMASWDASIANSKASIIVINFGLNDLLGTPQNFPIDVEQYRLNLITMVNTVIKYNKIPILVTPNMATTFSNGSQDISKGLKEFAETMVQVAEETNVTCIDMNSYVDNYCKSGIDISTLFIDGVHPSKQLQNSMGLLLANTFINASTIKENDILPAVTSGVRYYDGSNISKKTPTSKMGYGIIANKIRIPIFVETKGLDIYIANAIWDYGTPSCDVKVDLNSIKIVNNFDVNLSEPKVDNEVMVIKDATIGVHYIELDAKNNQDTGLYYIRAYKTNNN